MKKKKKEKQQAQSLSYIEGKFADMKTKILQLADSQN